MTKRQLEDMLITTLFEVKGMMEENDTNKDGGDAVMKDGNHIYDYEKKKYIFTPKGKSEMWKGLLERMKVLQGRHKHYKFIIDEMKELDGFFDEVGLDGFNK